jgi:hypothetical protein
MPHNLLGLCTYLSEYMRTPLFPPIKFHQTFWIWFKAAAVTTGGALREHLNLWYHLWKLILLLLICFLGFCMCGFDGGKLFVQFSRTNLLCMKVLLPEVTWSDRFVVSCYTERLEGAPSNGVPGDVSDNPLDARFDRCEDNQENLSNIL